MNLKTKIQKKIIHYLWNKKPYLVRKFEKYLDWTQNGIR